MAAITRDRRRDLSHGAPTKLKESARGKIATVVGATMRWTAIIAGERVQLAWKLIFLGEGTYTDDVVAAVKGEYGQKKTDEFMPAFVCVKEPRPLIAEGDAFCFSIFAATARGSSARSCCATDFKASIARIVPRSAFCK